MNDEGGRSNMFELPFPDTRHGWAAAIILSFVLFILYYCCIYPLLESFNSVNMVVVDSVVLVDGEEIFICYTYPRSYLVDKENFVIIKFVNNSKKRTKVNDIKVEVKKADSDSDNIFDLPDYFIEPLDNSLKKNFMPNNISEEDKYYVSGYNDTMIIKVLNPDEKITKVIRFDSQYDEINIFHNGMNDNPIKLNIVNKFDPFKFLLYALTINLLLPPWSNGIIPLIALILVWFAEERINKESEIIKVAENQYLVKTEETNKFFSLYGVYQSALLQFFGLTFIVICTIIYIFVLYIFLSDNSTIDISFFNKKNSVLFTILIVVFSIIIPVLIKYKEQIFSRFKLEVSKKCFNVLIIIIIIVINGLYILPNIIN